MQLKELEAHASKDEMRAKITALESLMKKDKENIIHIEPKHYFANGLYAREITIPKGALLTGMIHKTEHLCVLSKGKVSVYTDDGMKIIESSTVVHSSPGMKRVLFAHEDSVWINFHHNPTNEKDLNKIEEIYVVDSFPELEYSKSPKTYLDALKAIGVTHEECKQISENESDRDFNSQKENSIEIKESQIEGLGLFAAKDFESGEIIAESRIKGLRTLSGRYSNHSGNPNAKIKMLESGDCVLIACKKINSGEEITTDYFYSFKDSRSNREIK